MGEKIVHYAWIHVGYLNFGDEYFDQGFGKPRP